MKKVQRVVRKVQPHWVGDGFPVRSLFSYDERNDFDPFLLLDYGGPYDFSPTDEKRGDAMYYRAMLARQDRDLRTAKKLIEDVPETKFVPLHSGSQGVIGPGDVQWMTAASGIVHEEFHSRRFAKEGGTLEMVQLWVNLPAKDKQAPPRYQGILDADIPQVSLPDGAGTARVIAGECQGTNGPAQTFTPINVWDLGLKADRECRLEIPEGHTVVLVIQQGSVVAGDESATSGDLLLMEREGTTIGLQATEPARVLVLTGEPLGEPVVAQGPFVMNTRDEIRRAIQDYQSGRMGRLS